MTYACTWTVIRTKQTSLKRLWKVHWVYAVSPKETKDYKSFRALGCQAQ